MTQQGSGIIDRLADIRGIAAWGNLAARATDMPPQELHQAQGGAQALRARLDELLHTAGERLSHPRPGAAAFQTPYGTDWAWRPALWSGPSGQIGICATGPHTRLGPEVELFHDCPHGDLILRQLRNRKHSDLAPYGLSLDVLKFGGSFLSLVVDLPRDVCKGMSLEHILHLETLVEVERPLEVFARLNIRHGPNVAQLVREIPPGRGLQAVDFDLAYSGIEPAVVSAVWLDLIFDRPEMNNVVLRDLTLSRRPRAQI